ncbi:MULTISPECIES: GtrA family protein [Isoptericola]|uniref:GtrA family protein n=1 Tax=Isoptericola haloaureus TaxID=1542902 RepID=A0ABU7Z4W0_9MICO|nr:GtrA family protein [Isoptericola sp. AK164]
MSPSAPAPASVGRPVWPVRLVAALWRRRLELLRFGTVGGVAFVVDFTLFNLMTHGPVDVLAHKPVTVNIIATGVATLVSWVGNRYWTFATRRTRHRVRELLEYGAVNVGGMAISSLCLAVSRYLLDLDSVLADNTAKVVGLVLGMVFRYVLYRTVVFRGDG